MDYDVDVNGDLPSVEERLQKARELLDRLGASRRALAPGSAAERHHLETGHRLEHGCCLRGAASDPAESKAMSQLAPSGR